MHPDLGNKTNKFVFVAFFPSLETLGSLVGKNSQICITVSLQFETELWAASWFGSKDIRTRLEPGMSVRDFHTHVTLRYIRTYWLLLCRVSLRWRSPSELDNGIPFTDVPLADQALLAGSGRHWSAVMAESKRRDKIENKWNKCNLCTSTLE